MNARLESVYAQLVDQHEKHVATMNMNDQTDEEQNGFEVKERNTVSRNQPREIFDDIFFGKEVVNADIPQFVYSKNDTKQESVFKVANSNLGPL